MTKAAAENVGAALSADGLDDDVRRQLLDAYEQLRAAIDMSAIERHIDTVSERAAGDATRL